MSTGEPICRECHQDGTHKLSCSHVRYEGRVDVVESDDIVPDHTPAQPYCPGPEVTCVYADLIGEGQTRCRPDHCYYRHQEE